MKAALCIVCMTLAACAPKHTPEEALRIAVTYADLDWQPRQWHIRHGKDSAGIPVHTPDTTLASHTGDSRGWWEPGVPAKGMAYKWGGFDTPESFLQGLREGKKAGDIANTYKVRNDNAAISSESVGIDCSGFVSRCWGLDRHYDTRELPGISDPVSWDELLPGDIILKSGHVLMFAARKDGYVIGYEAGPKPTWRARRGAILISYLKKEGYNPWRYRHMAKPSASATEIQYDIYRPRSDAASH
ncbi:hypothetical protein HZ994_09845 [Akkermansiaceae bacterium]|nr:hypothetical protein HZ994_09845 [Akkermansiaceae bacterium]